MGASAKEKVQQIPIDDSAYSRMKRNKIFFDFNANNNTWISLDKIEKGLTDVLDLPELFETKSMIMMAYKISLKKVKAKNPLEEGVVSRGAFKWIILYVRFYYQLWEDFA